MYDVIILGAGPAGISAALYAKRAGRTVAVFRHGAGELEKATRIDNYYGFPGGVGGSELMKNGVEQARALGVDVIEKEVLGAQMTLDFTYTVKTSDEEYECTALIIATGTKKLKPNIPGVDEFEGKGVSYCAVCDGFFYRQKDVAVIGASAYAVSEADELSQVASSVTILTDGKDAPETTYPVETKKIAALKGENKLTTVVFEDGGEKKLDGVFIALGSAGGADLAKKLGAVTDGDSLKVDESMATNIPGVFACGNVTGGLLQVCKAVYEGAKAGLSASQFVRGKK